MRSAGTPVSAGKASAFGHQLRSWRRLRGLSQLELAGLAETTPRYLSFVETGRSRPGREVVLRLAACLDLPLRERNALLAAAGLAAEFPERGLDQQSVAPFVAPVRAILERHSPYPGSAYDARGKVYLTNESFRKMVPGAEQRTPEEAIEAFYGEHGRALFENWEELAWAAADRRRLEACNSSSEELLRLSELALSYLRDVPRPTPPALSEDTPVVCARFTVDRRRLSTFSTLLRFSSAREVTLSELRLELVFPADEATASFFRELAEA